MGDPKTALFSAVSTVGRIMASKLRSIMLLKELKALLRKERRLNGEMDHKYEKPACKKGTQRVQYCRY